MERAGEDSHTKTAGSIPPPSEVPRKARRQLWSEQEKTAIRRRLVAFLHRQRCRGRLSVWQLREIAIAQQRSWTNNEHWVSNSIVAERNKLKL